MPKRTLQGVVVSDKQAKTVVVRVDRRFTHPIYKKTIRRSKHYHAHDENTSSSRATRCWIEESKPISKMKRWNRGPGRKKKRPEVSSAPRDKTAGYFKRDFAHHERGRGHQ